MTEAPRLAGLSQLTEVGHGGYGVVYRAWQDGLRRYVAVKVLSARLDERAAARFAQECRALGTVSGHPHIVAVYAAGTTDAGEPYLVMPFCDGGSLADRLHRNGPLPWQEVLDVGVRLAGALQTAHDARILHRDLKPANVLVDGYRTPRLADFGQARQADADRSHTGVVATPAYAAPEVLRGAPAGPSSDLYSLVATLFALAAGHGPFSWQGGENVATVMFRVLSEAPANLRGRGVPDPVCRVLEWGLAKDPRHRPPSAAQFGSALQSVQRSLGLPVTEQAVPGAPAAAGGAPAPQAAGGAPGAAGTGGAPAAAPPRQPTPSRRRRWKWAAAAAVAVLVLTGGVLGGLRLAGLLAPGRDPEALLLGAGDYGVDGLSANPSLPTGFTPLFGTEEEPRTTDLASCVGLPVQSIERWRHTSVYTAGPGIGGTRSPQPFTSAQSAGLVMSDEQAARSMVDQWNEAGFSRCQPQLVGAGANFATGNETPLVTGIRVTELDRPAPLRRDVPYAGKRVDVPLSLVDRGKRKHLYVDFMLTSARESVTMAIVEHFPEPPSQRVDNATITAMRAKLG